jgi:hypothetical protein
MLCAFRFEIGCDWWGYYNQYEVSGITIQQRDPLWWIIIAEIKKNVLATAVMFLGLHVLAKRQPDPLSFLVFLFPILIVHIGMSGIRQAAAIGLVCVALAAFVERRLPKFVVFVLLASAVHSSAMVFLLLAPLVNGVYSRQRLGLAALLAAPGVALMLSSTSAEVAVTRYIDTDVDALGAAFRVGLLALTGATFFLRLRGPWLSTGSLDYKLASIGSLGMLCLVPLLPLSTVISDRFGYYLVPIQALILARIPFLPLIRGKSYLVLLVYAALGLTLISWVSLSSHYDRCYAPYETWIFGLPHSSFRYQ